MRRCSAEVYLYLCTVYLLNLHAFQRLDFIHRRVLAQAKRINVLVYQAITDDASVMSHP